jgi:hypothetical protein
VKFPPPPPGAERRRHHRQDVFATVELEWEEDVYVTPVLNVSLGGAFLELPPDVTVDTGSTIHVNLSAGEHAARQAARVIRITDGGCACAWISPTAETLTVLAILMGAESFAGPELVRTAAGS